MKHDRRHLNPGFAPTRWPADALIQVVWGNGNEARHLYTAGQLRWSRTGHPFDVDTFWKA